MRRLSIVILPLLLSPGRLRGGLGVVVFLVGYGALPMVRAADLPTPKNLEQTTTEWVKTRTETVRLDTEWRNSRQLLESTVAGLKERAETLEAKRDYVVATTSKDRAEIADVEQRDRQAVATLQATETRVRALSDRLIALRRSLPPRLSTALEFAYRSLGNPELPVAERMQHNLTILNRCTQFNRTITAEEEVIATEPGVAPRLLEVMYWGLGQAYALDRSGGKAWLGAPGPDGWRWQAKPDAVPEVKRLMAIHRDQGDPDFVRVPAQLVHAAGTRPTTTP